MVSFQISFDQKNLFLTLLLLRNFNPKLQIKDTLKVQRIFLSVQYFLLDSLIKPSATKILVK